MKITLTSNAVAYDIFTLLKAQDPNLDRTRSCRGLNIQVPDQNSEVANAGVIVRIGRPNAAATAVDQPEIVLSEGESYNYPGDWKNTISLIRSAIASVNNAVLYVNPQFA